jgi:hypothetical protein
MDDEEERKDESERQGKRQGGGWGGRGKGEGGLVKCEPKNEDVCHEFLDALKRVPRSLDTNETQR